MVRLHIGIALYATGVQVSSERVACPPPLPMWYLIPATLALSVADNETLRPPETWLVVAVEFGAIQAAPRHTWRAVTPVSIGSRRSLCGHGGSAKCGTLPWNDSRRGAL
jgi:hypothetical protein